MRGIPERPEGLAYQPDLLDSAEERAVLTVLDEMAFHEVRMHGQAARRTARHYDLDYGYESWRLVPTDPLPEPLWWLRDRCAGLAGVEPESLAQTLVTRYPPGATIGWHRDAPMFGAVVVGVSLLSTCVMRFQRRVGDERRVYEQELAPRSGYVLGGPARSAWQHSIPAVPDLRYSITFRTLRDPERWLPGEAGRPVTDGG
jgi:alkylated DNA repair protein (DNA oxidative demethylase)